MPPPKLNARSEGTCCRSSDVRGIVSGQDLEEACRCVLYRDSIRMIDIDQEIPDGPKTRVHCRGSQIAKRCGKGSLERGGGPHRETRSVLALSLRKASPEEEERHGRDGDTRRRNEKNVRGSKHRKRPLTEQCAKRHP